jgi:hypothetical protein
MRFSIFVTLLAVMLVLVGLCGRALPAVAWGAECLNEQVRAREPHAGALPDCRAYEQVSPVDKNFVDALGYPDDVQASPSGTGVTFFSLAPFPGIEGGQAEPIYLSVFADGGWLTQGISPRSDPGSVASVLGWDEGLNVAVVSAEEPFSMEEPFDAEGAAPGHLNLYVRDNASGSYRLLAPGPNEGHFADATPDGSRILFEDEAKLTEDAVAGVLNLYEWSNSGVSLVGLLPAAEGGGAPAGGAVAGAGITYYAQHAISDDGSRVFFTSGGRIYVREVATKTTLPVSTGLGGAATWLSSTPNGAAAFYSEGGELYRFDVGGGTREALTHPDNGNAGVLGMLGASDDGSYAYFVATGLLAGENDEGRSPVEGEPNVYRWHDGEVVFIATLNDFYDEANWRAFWESEVDGPAQGYKTSRVTPDGGSLLFASVDQLTSHENAQHHELYLYDAVRGRLTCVSCNLTGAAATNDAFLSHGESATSVTTYPFITRNLSQDGNEVFFQTEESLVPQDVDGRMDVYEWQREGTGSCPGGQGDCLYLISTGTNANPSYFGDASSNGEDVFFFTRQPLVGQDRDDNLDLYDARVGGGIAAQTPSIAEPCSGEACREPVGPPPAFGPVSSVAVSDLGVVESGSVAKRMPALSTRARKLASALRACGKKPRRRRAVCERQARRRYGARGRSRAAVSAGRVG